VIRMFIEMAHEASASVARRIRRLCSCKKHLPTLGFEGGKATHCSECKTSGMVNVVSPKCHCKKGQPSFGVEGGRATHCSDARRAVW
jgi:hypothetical protein